MPGLAHCVLPAEDYEIPYLEVGVAIGNGSSLKFEIGMSSRRCLAEIIH
jgi:hypothetical protein